MGAAMKENDVTSGSLVVRRHGMWIASPSEWLGQQCGV